MASRFGATIEQIGHDLGEGLDNASIPGAVLKGVRNIGVATWHAIQGVIPSVANAFNGQEFSVERRTGAFTGTSNAVKKVFQTKGIVGKASAVLAELTDGPVDDALGLIGGSQWIIVPQTRGKIATNLKKAG